LKWEIPDKRGGLQKFSTHPEDYDSIYDYEGAIYDYEGVTIYEIKE